MSTEYHNGYDYSRFRVVGYPVRHKRKIPFEPRLAMYAETRRMIRDIGAKDLTLSGYILSEKDYLDLATEAYASNIHWSTKIEGNRMTLEEVRELTRRYTSGGIGERPDGPAQEILNHLGSVLSQDLFAMPWDTGTVRDIHRILMTGVGETAAGGIRDCDMSVAGTDGTEHFIACPHQHVTEELENLLGWVNTSPYGEIVTASLFFHEFESIHPFADGNGRTGRVLFQTLLREMGLRNCSLCRFEERLVKDTRTYYDLLAYTDATLDYTPLVRYITEALDGAYTEAVEVFSAKDLLGGMEENTRVLARTARDRGTFAFREAAGWVSLGEASVRSRLDELVEMGILGKDGHTRSMRYTFLDPFRDLRGRALEDLKGSVGRDDLRRTPSGIGPREERVPRRTPLFPIPRSSQVARP